MWNQPAYLSYNVGKTFKQGPVQCCQTIIIPSRSKQECRLLFVSDTNFQTIWRAQIMQTYRIQLLLPVRLNLLGNMSLYIINTYQYLLGFTEQLPEQSEGMKVNIAFVRSLLWNHSLELNLSWNLISASVLFLLLWMDVRHLKYDALSLTLEKVAGLFCIKLKQAACF